MSDRDLWIRGRVLLVFGREAMVPSSVATRGMVTAMARELGVSRQQIYRSCPEMSGQKGPR